MVFVVECEYDDLENNRFFCGEDMDRPKLDEFGGEPCEHDNVKGLKVRKLKQMVQLYIHNFGT